MNKHVICAGLCFILFLSQLGAQQRTEDSLSLNNVWQFKTDPNNIGEKRNWHSLQFDDSGWEQMSVPSNWDTRNEYADYAGKAWYRKKVQVPADWKGKLVRVLFEAVYHDSKVWLNNRLLGTSNSGFLPFEFDVSALLDYGGNNTIVVCTDNSFRRGAIWNWGGIRRPAFLVAGETVRVASQFISPEVDLNKGTSTVAVRAVLKNSSNNDEDIRGEVILTSKNGFRRSMPFARKLAARSQQDVFVKTVLTKNEVHLWSYDDPFLYQSEVIIQNNKGFLHKATDRFGLRKIELDNKNYVFKLNGQSIRPMGFNLVPDDRTTGNTLPLWRIKEDIDLMKSLGANMARLTHLPLPKEALDYLDEKGIMIFDEIPLWGFDVLADKTASKPREWLQRLMDRDYNHACVIGWSVGNEIGHYPHSMEYVEDAIDYIHKKDSIHLAVMVSHTADRSRDPLDFSDIGLVNKYGAAIGSVADRMHRFHPDKILFYSEFGYGQLAEDLNSDVAAKAMVDSIRFKPYLIGGSLWTFNDYRSSYAGTKEFSENRPWGVVDVFRQKKKAYYSFRKEYAPIRDMKVEGLKIDQVSEAKVVITPRKKLDLPAYEIKNYLLAWKALDAGQKIVDGGFAQLPVIKPGDAVLSRNIQWQGDKKVAALKIELVSPLDYSVWDTVINLQQPVMPEIIYAQGVRTDMNDLPANSGGIRVVFKKDPFTKGYKVKYGKGSLTEETAVTVNHFIDIPKLEVHESYIIQLIAINDAGETSTPAQTVKIGFGIAPPVLYYAEPTEGGFFIGYASQADDYLYRVQYTTVKGDYKNSDTIQTSTKGVLLVPHLKNGQTYYYRMQRIKQNSYESTWSEEKSIAPDGGVLPMPPIIKGVINQNGESLVCFEPVKKAIGYLLQYKDERDAVWTTISIDAATIDQYKITGLKNAKYQYKVATITSNGLSLYSEIF